MKLKFGDLQSKADADAHGKRQALFERRVMEAMRLMRNYVDLPPKWLQPHDYPASLRGYSLDVLHEAVCRERARRADKP